MISKSDWTAVHQQLLAEGRERLGEPPTEEQLLAYRRGELHGEEEARVRELLVYYPELARTLDNPSSAEVKPGDADYLSDEELAADWAALQGRLYGAPAGAIPVTGGRVLPFWPTLAAAAALVIVLGGLLIRAYSAPDGVQQPGRPSIALEETFLLPDGRRGPDEPTTVSNEQDLLLVAALTTQKEYPDYRLDIIEADTVLRRVVWSSTGLRRRTDSTFYILVPQRFLAPGKYQLVVYGLEGKAEQELVKYTIVVTGRA